jgi:hypothetical protein
MGVFGIKNAEATGDIVHSAFARYRSFQYLEKGSARDFDCFYLMADEERCARI